jgi:hypothetical protein
MTDFAPPSVLQSWAAFFLGGEDGQSPAGVRICGAERNWFSHPLADSPRTATKPCLNPTARPRHAAPHRRPPPRGLLIDLQIEQLWCESPGPAQS